MPPDTSQSPHRIANITASADQLNVIQLPKGVPAMNVTLIRRPSSYGRWVPLEVLVNGKSLAWLPANDEVQLELDVTDIPASIEVRMQGVVGSPPFLIDRLSSGMCLECGGNLWPLFDFFSLNLWIGSILKNHVFYLQKVRTA